MTPELLTVYRKVYDLQKQCGMTFAEMGVRFMVAQSEMNVIIIGAKTPEEIAECVKAARAGPLPDDIVSKLDQITTGNVES